MRCDLDDESIGVPCGGLDQKAGESTRVVAPLLGLNQRTVMRYRAWADEQGLLVAELPDPPALHRLNAATLPTVQPLQQISSVAPYGRRSLSCASARWRSPLSGVGWKSGMAGRSATARCGGWSSAWNRRHSLELCLHIRSLHQSRPGGCHAHHRYAAGRHPLH